MENAESIGTIGPDDAGIRNTPQKEVSLSDSTGPGAVGRAETVITPPGLSCRDYKPLDFPERRAHCAACGRRGVDYIEKVTTARKARKDKTALRICKKCYLEARSQEQAAAPPLPGTLVLSRMVRTTKEIGRCSVCNLGKAVFSDKETMTHIRQQFYDREAGASGNVENGVSE